TRVTARRQAGATVTAGKPRMIYVKRKKFRLNYKLGNVGTSGVKHVEVWFTREDKKIWTHFADAPGNGPFLFTAGGEGRYGVTLCRGSNAGLAPSRPAAGQEPAVWVEVDETKPVVILHSVLVGTGKDQGTMTINWSATDRNLKAKPITIKQSASK